MLERFIKTSNYINEQAEEQLKNLCKKQNLNYTQVRKETHLSSLMEGLYIKVETETQVTERYKYVRAEFIKHIQQNEHWQNQIAISNQLIKNNNY